MKIEPKFDINKATLDHVWLGTDGGGNDVFIVRVTDKENGTERFVWPGESLDRTVRLVTDMAPSVRKFLNWCRRALLETENVVVSANAVDIASETGMDLEYVKDAMVQVSKMQNGPDGGGDGDWMEWHDQDNWDADVYPQLLAEFLWVLPRTEELTDDDLDAIHRFNEDLVEFFVSHAIAGVGKTPDDIRWLVDRAEFVALLADEICEFCADHGVDLHYPEQVTDTFTGDQVVHQFAEPDSYSKRATWVDMLQDHIDGMAGDGTGNPTVQTKETDNDSN